MASTPNNTQNQGGLVGLIQGIQRPNKPPDFEKLPEGLRIWINENTEYLRRLGAQFTPKNILITINQATPGVLVGWRYNAATHTFQVKRVLDTGLVGDWETAEGDQPVALTPVTESVYLDGTELKALRVASAYVLEKGEESVVDTGCGCGSGSGDMTPCCTTACGCKYRAGTTARATIIWNSSTSPYSVGTDIPMMQEVDGDGNVINCGTFKATNIISPTDGTAYDIASTSTCIDGVITWQLVVNFHAGAVSHTSTPTISDCGGFTKYDGDDIYIFNVATDESCA